MIRNLVAAFLAAAVVSLPMSAGASADPVRVRGTIASFSGDTLTVKTREGQTADIALAPGWALSSVSRAAISDIKPGDYVGIASLPTQDGQDGALEVVIFPPALKGTGEGSYGWDLKPNSTMTNGTVANAVTDVNGQTVTVSYFGKEKEIAIPDGTPVVTFAAATDADLKPGAEVFVAGEKDANGSITAQRVVVGTNGVAPPM
jgi:hypothetical protein